MHVPEPKDIFDRERERWGSANMKDVRVRVRSVDREGMHIIRV